MKTTKKNTRLTKRRKKRLEQIRYGKDLAMGIESLEDRQMLAGNVVATITGAGDLVVRGDAADNTVAVEVDSVGNVTVTGYDGTTVDDTNLSSTQLSGNIRISTFGGDDNVAIYGGDYDIPVENISIVTGSGNDQALIANVDGIDGQVNINTGVGNDAATIKYANATGNVTINSGAGSDTNVLNTVTGNDIKINSGADADADFVYQTAAVDDMTITSTSGNDTVNIEGVIAADLNVSTGSGDDQVYITEAHTKYDTSLTTAGGNDKLVITNSEVTGDLKVNTGAGDDQLCMKYIQSAAEGRTTVSTGAGNDQFEIGEVEIGDSANLNLGGGADEVAVIGSVVGTGVANGGTGIDGISDAANIGGLGLTSFEKYA